MNPEYDKRVKQKDIAAQVIIGLRLFELGWFKNCPFKQITIRINSPFGSSDYQFYVDSHLKI